MDRLTTAAERFPFLPPKTGAVAAIVGLLAMFALMVGSAWNESATYDEVPHIGAGFAYLTQRDYRLNAEAAFLPKILAALSAELAVHPRVPADTRALQKGDATEQGRVLLYESGNDAGRIVFWARMPMMILALAFGAILFLWTRRHFGDDASVITLLFFAFSPTLLAHARLVNNDFGATFGFFIGIAAYLRFLDAPTRANVLIAGFAFAIAELCKFSDVTLAPVLAMLLGAWLLTLPPGAKRSRATVEYVLKTLAVFVVGALVIWIFYGCLVWGSGAPARYPDAYVFPSQAFREGGRIVRAAVLVDLASLRYPLTRPMGEFLLGLLVSSQRVANGGAAYLFGRTIPNGSHLYFPLLYVFKEPLALHLLTLVALWLTARPVFRSFGRGRQPLYPRVSAWVRVNFVTFAALTFIAVYWAIAISSRLNIGVRHVMPTFPFIYVLVSARISRWLHEESPADGRSQDGLEGRFAVRAGFRIKWIVTALVTVGLIVGTARSFPCFLSYYNLLGGGTKNGWRIAVDSNYDWGQDLKRLQDFVVENHIRKISLDYFGSAEPEYYLGDTLEMSYRPPSQPAHGWFAISATVRQMPYLEHGDPFGPGMPSVYDWLRAYKPVARAGCSMFIYRLP